MRSSSSRSGTERGTRRRGAATRRALLALGAACLVGGASPEPPTEETQELLSAIQSRWERVQSVRARFEQRSRVAALGSDEVSQGSVLVARPGRMRWEYEAPQPSVIVVDGDAVRIYSPADEQLQIAPLTREMLSPTALGFLLGESAPGWGSFSGTEGNFSSSKWASTSRWRRMPSTSAYPRGPRSSTCDEGTLCNAKWQRTDGARQRSVGAQAACSFAARVRAARAFDDATCRF